MRRWCEIPEGVIFLCAPDGECPRLDAVKMPAAIVAGNSARRLSDVTVDRCFRALFAGFGVSAASAFTARRRAR